MSSGSHDFLRTLDSLPANEQWEVTVEILRRGLKMGAPPLTDEELVSLADATFLELDRQESADG